MISVGGSDFEDDDENREYLISGCSGQIREVCKTALLRTQLFFGISDDSDKFAEEEMLRCWSAT